MKITVAVLFTFLFATNALSYNFASPSEPSGKLILNHSQAAKQLFPVTLLEVNGENVNPRSDAVWLSPGEYELKFSSHLDTKYTKRLNSPSELRGNKDSINTMTITVEADKSYYVAYDASDSQTEFWKPVVYKEVVSK